MNFLLITDNDKSHYVCIKDFDRFMHHKTKHKEKKHFCKSNNNNYALVRNI